MKVMVCRGALRPRSKQGMTGMMMKAIQYGMKPRIGAEESVIVVRSTYIAMIWGGGLIPDSDEWSSCFGSRRKHLSSELRTWKIDIGCQALDIDCIRMRKIDLSR